VNARLRGPKFGGGQCKRELTQGATKFDLPEAFLKRVLKTGILDGIARSVDARLQDTLGESIFMF
jgi:hypothetical protein